MRFDRHKLHVRFQYWSRRLSLRLLTVVGSAADDETLFAIMSNFPEVIEKELAKIFEHVEEQLPLLMETESESSEEEVSNGADTDSWTAGVVHGEGH